MILVGNIKIYFKRIGETTSLLMCEYEYMGLVQEFKGRYRAVTFDGSESLGWKTEDEAKAWLLGMFAITRDEVSSWDIM